MSETQFDERTERRRLLKEALRVLSLGRETTTRGLFGDAGLERWPTVALGKLREKGYVIRRAKNRWQLAPDQNVMRYLQDEAALAGLLFEPDENAVAAELEKVMGTRIEQAADPLHGMTPFERIVVENVVYIRGLLEKLLALFEAADAERKAKP